MPDARDGVDAAVTPLDGGVVLLDTRFDGRSKTVGVYLVPHAHADGRAGRFDLVEAGPAITFEGVLAAIREAGFAPEGLDTLLVTHVHLDHAGAAGAFAARFGCRVVAHARGAPHLADPGRLLASARRVYGDALEARWGGMEPVPSERLVSVDDGDHLELGGRSVRVHATPGHARHHAAFAWPDGSLFVGDAAGVRLPGSDVIRPALPPPEVDLEAWDETLAALAATRPSRLLLTHYGEVAGALDHLAEVGRRNRVWADTVLASLRAGADERSIALELDRLATAELEAAGADADTVARHLVTSDAAMTTSGLVRYWTTQHPERLALS
ncbi:MAG: MBL fold metallo-hydrolase [Trueperaceae bacterium]|nr:MBL fold metallo-hydrolase [Trueperaceae bacterium]